MRIMRYFWVNIEDMWVHSLGKVVTSNVLSGSTCLPPQLATNIRAFSLMGIMQDTYLSWKNRMRSVYSDGNIRLDAVVTKECISTVSSSTLMWMNSIKILLKTAYWLQNKVILLQLLPHNQLKPMIRNKLPLKSNYFDKRVDCRCGYGRGYGFKFSEEK